MDNLSKRLKNNIDVYGKTSFVNKLDELDYSFGFIKSVWSEILPTGGVVKTIEGNGIYSDVSHKITVRGNSIPGLSNDMYFMYEGQGLILNSRNRITNIKIV